MELSFSPEQEAWRQEIRSFLRAEVPPEFEGEFGDSPEGYAYVREMNKKLAAKGWLTMAWPKEFGGGGAGAIEQLIFHEEYGYNRGPNLGPGVRFIGPALISQGTEEQQKRYLPLISSASVWWCQGFSEPGTGSDLASLQTRAVPDGDDFIINGTKIWTTLAHYADLCWMAVRTNPDAPKHRGISLFVLDMKTPGITIRPIVNMAGIHHFNQVYFDDVRVPRENMIGPLDRGWYVMSTTLDFERSARVTSAAGARRTLEDLVAYAATTTGSDGRPIGKDPVVAAKLSRLAIDIEVARLFAYQVATTQLHGKVPNREGSILKLWCSELEQRLALAGMEILGPNAMLASKSGRSPMHGHIQHSYLESFSATLASGASEIQRNVIARRGLDMPR